MISSQEWRIALKSDGCTVATVTSASKYNFSIDLKVSAMAT